MTKNETLVMDQIFISQLRLETTIGVYPEERLAPQRLALDIELTVDTRKAAQSDNIADAIDYDELTRKLQYWSAEQPFHLVEALAGHLAEKILGTYNIQAVRLKLHKFPAGLPIASAGVVVVREKP